MCVKELEIIEFSVNPLKSTWIRIGNRNGCACSALNVNNVLIQCLSEIKFLGTVIITASKFKISLSKNKICFFNSVNKLFSKLGCSDPAILLTLINSHCISALMYNLEACDLSKSELNSLNFVVTRALMKLFKTFDNDNILYCMFCSGQLPIELIMSIRKYKFLEKLLKKCDMLTEMIKPIIVHEKCY